MNFLFRRTPLLRFGGSTKGSIKKISGVKIDYDSWQLKPSTRSLLSSVHHPLVLEYFLRLNDKRQEIQHLAAQGDAKAYPANAVDGSPFDLVRWEIVYSNELDVTGKLANILRDLDESVSLKESLLEKKKQDTQSPEDKEMLEMVEEDIVRLVGEVESLNEDVNRIMERRINADDIMSSSSRMWNCTMAGKAGGEEASLFAGELAEIFKTYAKEFRGYQVKDLGPASSAEGSSENASSSLSTDVGEANLGFQFQLIGDDVYRYFHHEIGVHKVQRVPVTDAVGKMQTSTAVFSMVPVLDPVSVNVEESDCTINYVRGSGPGGQGMQSSSNCVVLTHKPSGITVKCHQSRSALGNKELALQMVAQQILADKVKQQNSSLHAAWSSQWSSGERADKMRTYNFPQNRVTDHRLGKDFPLSNFLDRGSGLVLVHDELNAEDDLRALSTVLLRHINGKFGSTV